MSLGEIQPRERLDILDQASDPETLTRFQWMAIQSLIDAERRGEAARVLAFLMTRLEPGAVDKRVARADALVGRIGERRHPSAPRP
jgi:hypothetical protein